MAKKSKAKPKASKAKAKPARKKTAKRPAAKVKAAKAKPAKAKKSKKIVKAKRPAAKKTAKPVAKKAASKPVKKTVKTKKQTVGEGNYEASRAFDKDQANFVKRNKDKIPALAKAAEAALDGPEGDSLREAEATAADRSRDTF